MPVTDTHAQYKANKDKWRLVADCVEGSSAVKLAGTNYLPMPNPSDKSIDNLERYRAYKDRAVFVNFTGSTLEGLLGMVFRKDTTVELPPLVEYLTDDFNGNGVSLDQSLRSITAGVIKTGRVGLLVDYPQAPEGLTAAQVAALGLRASVLKYNADDVINWRSEMVNGTRQLSLVVLRELREEIGADGFSAETATYYRVLMLQDGVYIQRLYDEDGNPVYFDTGAVDETGQMILSADAIILDAKGEPWNFIPFVFVGATNNDETPDKSPLYDIAEVNIAHYRNSADYEESSFMVGQPTPYAAGLTQSWVEDVMKGGIMIGSRSFVLLPEGGNAGLLQANPNQMPKEGMADKERQMVKLGARIIEDASTNETAEGAKIRFSGQTSKLATIVGNVESAVKSCIEWAMIYMGEPAEFELEMNRQFYDATMDPQMVIAQIQLVDRGILAKTDIRANLRRGGMVSPGRTDEEIDGEAEETSFSFGGFGE